MERDADKPGEVVRIPELGLFFDAVKRWNSTVGLSRVAEAGVPHQAAILDRFSS
jgi:hypothetical protein